jgi:CRISPR system Cascade subunit CasA
MMMNLTTDPWIPVVWNDERAGMVNMLDAFQRGDDIQDLAVRPHERIALMRLLTCVAQAALDGPRDRADWETCRNRIAPAAEDYLKKWRSAFELFGDGQRFLQVANLKPASSDSEDDEGGGSVSKLDLVLATGNTATLFDNAGGSDRTLLPRSVALSLLSFQCFSPGGTIGVGLWNGQPTNGWKGYPKVKPGQSNHAPCLPGNMLHALLRGSQLLNTLWLNLLTKDTVELLSKGDAWGVPVWESMPNSPSETVATATYLGRLVPIARAVHLHADDLSAIIANGLDHPPYPEWREPTASIKVRDRNGTPERIVVGASLDRAPWRELSALAVRRLDRDTNGGPLALRNLPDKQPFDLWVGGLVADKAKLLDTVEAVFHVPGGMLTEPCQRIYEDGVRHAGEMDVRLRRAVSTYRKEMGNNLDRPELREQRKRIQTKATSQFWTSIERDVQKLLDVVACPPAWPTHDAWAGTAWGKTVWSALNGALDAVCAHDTPRQIRAFTLARQALSRMPQTKQATDALMDGEP